MLIVSALRRFEGDSSSAISKKIYIFVKTFLMEQSKHILEEPAFSYGRKVRIADISPQLMDNMEETLRERGYITYEELCDHLSHHQ